MPAPRPRHPKPTKKMPIARPRPHHARATPAPLFCSPRDPTDPRRAATPWWWGVRPPPHPPTLPLDLVVHRGGEYAQRREEECMGQFCQPGETGHWRGHGAGAARAVRIFLAVGGAGVARASPWAWQVCARDAHRAGDASRYKLA
eukprot:gene5005-biopygen10119